MSPPLSAVLAAEEGSARDQAKDGALSGSPAASAMAHGGVGGVGDVNGEKAGPTSCDMSLPSGVAASQLASETDAQVDGVG